MRRSAGRNPRTGNLARGLARQASLFVFLGVSVALLIAGKVNPTLSNRVHGALVDTAAPVIDFISQPVVAVREFGRRSGDVLRGADRVEVLRQENDSLRRWRDVALQLDQENAQLRALLRVRDRYEMPIVASRVVTDPAGPFLRAVILDSGGQKGISRNQPVLDEVGVVGRIVTVGHSSSRALLVTDLNSRLPVTLVRTGTRAILAGDNSDQPRLAFLPIDSDVRTGDQIVTSGDGGVFPPDLPVGVVESTEDNVVRVRLAANLGRLDFVNVVEYDPPPAPEENPVSEPVDALPDGTSLTSDGGGT